MKKFLWSISLLFSLTSIAQTVEKDTTNVREIEQLRAAMKEQYNKFKSLDEKLSKMSGDVDKVKKLHISGYIQAQYENYDYWNASGSSHGVPATSGAPVITNSFMLRRARVKFSYKAIDGVEFVLCPNFDVDRVQFKDAYVQLHDRWTKIFTLTMGQFLRPTTYEIDYSSSSREFAERSLMSRSLYPSEREQGVKLEADFTAKYKLPLKLTVAVVNGNFGEGTLTNQIKDVDGRKDIIGRASYSLSFPKQKLAIDFGGHAYVGSNTVISPPTNPYSDVNNNPFTPQVGDKLKKELFGAEAQIYWNFLGGLSLKSEYIRGTYSGQSYASEINSSFKGDRVRNIQGAYIALVKNIDAKNQLGFRWDMFDANTRLSGNAVDSVGDLKYNNYTFSYLYQFSSNVRIMACYVVPVNEKSANAALVATDYANRDVKDNTFTLRLQAKF
jgi:phosphate-selective porin